MSLFVVVSLNPALLQIGPLKGLTFLPVLNFPLIDRMEKALIKFLENKPLAPWALFSNYIGEEPKGVTQSLARRNSEGIRFLNLGTIGRSAGLSRTRVGRQKGVGARPGGSAG
jgi:hypothetical protein